ncbi:MAG TPA: DUF998 domain-containing protein [Mycobacterium sp.]|nr:DUF998 domain-containing protein [Mycobacterium sp.]
MTVTATTNRVQLTRVAALVWTVAAVVYLVVEKIAADHVKGHYSYLHHYISVLGVPDWGRFAWLMNGAFYLQGALMFVGAVLVTRASERRGVFFLLFTTAATIGYFLVATVHGGSPLAKGDGLQLHMAGALLVFIAGNLAIVPGSKVVARAVDARWWYRAVSLLIAALGLAAWLALANYNVWGHSYGPVGLLERIPVYSILTWQVFSAVVLLSLVGKRHVHVEDARV